MEVNQDENSCSHDSRLNEVHTETLIIGFGFSVIPLLRELDNSGKEYLIISSGDNVWTKFEREGRLDFDLVSSTHSSMYSFELVNTKVDDSYPTAKQFLTFQRKYQLAST